MDRVRIARHLILLKLREDGENTKNRRTESAKAARVRYDEARHMASLAGLGGTEYAVWADVQQACNAPSGSPAGRLGAEVSGPWLDVAAAALLAIWDGVAR